VVPGCGRVAGGWGVYCKERDLTYSVLLFIIAMRTVNSSQPCNDGYRYIGGLVLVDF